MKNLIPIICFFFISSSIFGQYIQDESFKDKSFWKFKVELENCIINKDLKKLRSLLAPGVLVAKDACLKPQCSKDDFIRFCFGEDGNNDDTWDEMLSIVRLGFFRTKKRDLFYEFKTSKDGFFAAPSYLNKINTDKEVIILGENVNIREKPSLKAKVLKMVSYQKFECDCNIMDMKKSTIQNIDGIEWLEIKLENGQIGYVSSELTSYKIYKEMTITKVKGKWKIISFHNGPGC